MSTCNRLDLQTPGSQPVIMPKNLLDHRSKPISKLGEAFEASSFHLSNFELNLGSYIGYAHRTCYHDPGLAYARLGWAHPS